MKLVRLDCHDLDLKTRLEINLQDGNDVDLVHFDYTLFGQFCETLAHSMKYCFTINATKETAFFRKREPK